jgi:hypothetical protein
MRPPLFPLWVRLACVLWLVVWIPAYWKFWGPVNFLHVCDVAVLLACAGIWFSDALLISSQAVASLFADAVWCLDVGWRLLFGRHLFGGTEYLWDARLPLWVRMLSLFHLVLPLLLLWALGRAGYDRRAWALQSAIAALLLVPSRFVDPAKNINFAFRDPLFHRGWGPAPIHMAFMWFGFVVLTYLPVHLLLARLFPSKTTTGARAPKEADLFLGGAPK